MRMHVSIAYTLLKIAVVVVHAALLIGRAWFSDSLITAANQ